MLSLMSRADRRVNGEKPEKLFSARIAPAQTGTNSGTNGRFFFLGPSDEWLGRRGKNSGKIMVGGERI
jgi:hypothetical protein